ncbi:hypothetical protein QAD02_012870, partial [Eretmocerus hayati]
MEEKFSNILIEVNCLVLKRDKSFKVDDNIDQEIKRKRLELDLAKKTLISKKSRALSSEKVSDKRRDQLKVLQANDPRTDVVLFRDGVVRSWLECDQKGMIEALRDILGHFGSAADKRRAPSVRAASSLDSAVEILHDMNYEISWSTLYSRMIPRDSTAIEGRRHVKTCPIKLCRARNDHHEGHPDQNFCRASISGLQTVAPILGPEQICIISQYNKAKVPIGRTAAKTQQSILMHVEYKVRLPDHDFPVGPRHNLIPSVPNIYRSGKHSSSTAATHVKDIDRLLELEDFKSIVKAKDGSDKLVIILLVDGGPDENPRFKTNLAHYVQTFLKRSPYGMFVVTNALGRSASNPVERRMAPLSRALFGLVLSHDHCGSHLDGSDRTVDLELEKENFKHAGETLASIWSEMCIDGYNVLSEFVPCDESLPEPALCSDHKWYANHVRESQYLLQILKCNDKNCCSPQTSNWNKFCTRISSRLPFQSSKIPSVCLHHRIILRRNFHLFSSGSHCLFAPPFLLRRKNCPTIIIVRLCKTISMGGLVLNVESILVQKHLHRYT